MRAIILAAGRGSRMGSLTKDQPKCMALAGGKPLIAWQISALRAAKIKHIAVVRGYQADRLPLSGLHAFDNPRWAQTNMVASLMCAEAWLKESPCIVSYSDILYSGAIIAGLIGSAGNIVVAYDRLWLEQWTKRFDNVLSDAETFRVDDDGFVIDIGRRPASLKDIQGQYMGLLKFAPDGWRRANAFLAAQTPSKRDAMDMTTLLRGLISAGAPIRAVAVNGGWQEVDNDRDLALADAALRAGLLRDPDSR